VTVGRTTADQPETRPPDAERRRDIADLLADPLLSGDRNSRANGGWLRECGEQEHDWE
jgi:hypothetical protein